MTIINFKVNDNGRLINVSYDGEWTCEMFMRDFTKNNFSEETIDPNVYTFKANGKFLNGEKFKNQKLKYLIRDQQIVNFVSKKKMIYSN